MVVLQAILEFVLRSTGKIVKTLFGWAVSAIFGLTTERETRYLSALVGAAAIWPLLLFGIFAPRVTAWVVSLAPIPKGLPEEWIRWIWIALAALVPGTVGLVFSRRAHVRSSRAPRHPLARFAWGFPITLGIACAFLLVLVIAPARRAVAALRQRRDEQIPLLVESEHFEETAEAIARALRDRDFELERREPTWSMRAPTAALRFFGGRVLHGALVEQVARWRAPGLDVVLQPNGVVLTGRPLTTARAHGLLDEALTASSALQTTDPGAQEIERELKAIWNSRGDQTRAAPRPTAGAKRLATVGRKIVDLQAPYGDWQVVYREALQVARALGGEPQLLAAVGPQEPPRGEERAAKAKAAAAAEAGG